MGGSVGRHAPENHEVLNHLLAEVVVDAVDLVLGEQTQQVIRQTLR